MATLSFEDNLTLVISDIARLIDDPSNHIKTDLETEDKAPIDTYVDYQNRRFIVSKDQTPRIDIIAGTLKKPVSVFKDYLQSKNSSEFTQTFHYLGLTKNSVGEDALVYVFAQRNVIVSSLLVKLDDANLVLERLSGVLIKRITV